jgi:hypothetical protein
LGHIEDKINFLSAKAQTCRLLAPLSALYCLAAQHTAAKVEATRSLEHNIWRQEIEFKADELTWCLQQQCDLCTISSGRTPSARNSRSFLLSRALRELFQVGWPAFNSLVQTNEITQESSIS